MATRQDITIRQGETWSYAYTHSGDITGYTARMSIKADWSSDAVAYLTNDGDADGGTITIAGAVATMAMTAAETDVLLDNSVLFSEVHAIKRQSVGYIYDLELVSPASVVTRALEGRVHILRGVTG